MTDKIDTSAAVYLIMKRGLFYRPNGNGYTGIKDHAGRYSFDDIAEHCPNIDSDNQDGVSFVLEVDAPDYSSACFQDLKERHMAKKAEEAIETLSAERDALRAEVERLTAVNKRWQKNSIDTWSAMTAMRDQINEFIPMPSLESDLLQGPENSIFCATVAEAVIGFAIEAQALKGGDA